MSQRAIARIARIALVALSSSVAMVALFVSPGQAQRPDATGWWNEVSAGSAALPQPTTAVGDLHVSNNPHGPMAFAGLRFLGRGGASDAVLSLKVTSGTTLGTPHLLACPTTGAAWSPGGDQAWASRPAYRCAGQSAVGVSSVGGAVFTFALDARLQNAQGDYNLAIVPDPTDQLAFQLDVTKPGPSAFTATPRPPQDTSARPPRSGDVPPPSGGLEPDPTPQDTEPLVAPGPLGEPSAAPDASSSPTVAMPLQGPTPFASTLSLRFHRTSPRARALVAVLLLDVLAYIVWTVRRPRRAPRLIGGRAQRQ